MRWNPILLERVLESRECSRKNKPHDFYNVTFEADNYESSLTGGIINRLSCEKCGNNN